MGHGVPCGPACRVVQTFHKPGLKLRSRITFATGGSVIVRLSHTSVGRGGAHDGNVRVVRPHRDEEEDCHSDAGQGGSHRGKRYSTSWHRWEAKVSTKKAGKVKAAQGSSTCPPQLSGLARRLLERFRLPISTATSS